MILLIEICVAAVISFFVKDVKSYFTISRKTFLYSTIFSFFYIAVMYCISGSQTALDSTLKDFTKGVALTTVLLFVYPPVIAFCEEFIFRLFAIKKFGILLAGLIFTVAHWRPVFPDKMFPILFLFALIQSFIFIQTKSIIAPMITHLAATTGLIVWFI